MSRTREALDDLSPDEPLTLLAGIVNVPDPDAGDHHDLYFGSDKADAEQQQPVRGHVGLAQPPSPSRRIAFPE